MKTKILYLLVIVTLLLAACSGGIEATTQPTSVMATQSTVTATVQSQDPSTLGAGDPSKGGTPPQIAIAACANKAASDTCSFTDQNGDQAGVCETVQSMLACSPKHNPSANGTQPGKGTGVQSGTPAAPDPASSSHNGANTGNRTDANGSSYNIEQAISDKAQGMTISFDALAFLTGDLGADSFFPPGKVADFWGFQYLRDNDPSQMGHAGEFLTSAAENMLNVLTATQRAQLVALANSQVDSINQYGYQRFVLIQAFQNLIDGKHPAGTTGLNEDAVKAYSSQLYQLDGEISYERAQL